MHVIFQFFIYRVNVFSFTSFDESFFSEQRWKKINWKKNKLTQNWKSDEKILQRVCNGKVDLSHQLLHVNFISEIFMLSLKKSLWKEDKNAVTIIFKYLLQILKYVVHKWKNEKKLWVCCSFQQSQSNSTSKRKPGSPVSNCIY